MQRYLPLVVALGFGLLSTSCNGGSIGSNNGDGGDGGGGDCVNLECRIVNCQAMGMPPSTLTGVVNIPAGNLPLYNATVYVPNSAVAPITNGASCDRCTDVSSGSPIVTTTTDSNGNFTLTNVPTGADIPLVIQLGKWRRQVTVPSVPSCQSTALATEMTRLPRNHSEGDMPRIALATGGYDAFECLLRKLGIDDSEFTPESGGGHVNLFAGHGGTNAYCTAGTGTCKQTLNGGANFTVASDGGTPGWWSSLDNLKQYDTIMLSCEGGQYATEKSAAAHKALGDYLTMGGRVFASHWHNVWMVQDTTASLNTIATFYDVSAGIEYNNPITANIYTNTDKSNALADWMLSSGGSTTRGALQILKARNSMKHLDKPELTERFVYYNDPTNGVVDQYFSFNTPVGAPMESQCGRMVFTDMHESGNDQMHPDSSLDQSLPTLPFPSGCITTALSAQEKALLFLLFDLTGCLAPVIG